jgi:uncharacterized membrane-anchored protein
MNTRLLIAWLTLALILVVVNWQVLRREMIREQGQVILLHLGPADPRSLIQGDYMRLNYAILNQLAFRDRPASGRLVLNVNPETRVASLRGTRGDVPKTSGQVYLRYHRAGSGRYSVGAESFFFQEGEAEKYAGARYAELRVSDTGESVLVALRDDHFRVLGTAR